MLSALMLAAALTGTPPDPLASAIEHYRTIESYRVTLHSTHADGEEYIRYDYKKPGFVRMEFIRPHAGTVLIYNPYTQSVRLWPFGVKHFPELSLSPGNPLIRSSRGQRVDHSDVGTLFENVRTLREGGNAEVSGDTKNTGPGTRESMDGRTVTHLIVTGAGNFVIAGVHRYELWLDTESQFPVKVISRDRQDAIIETVMMEALEINATLPKALFNP
jgi:outer membrane lipoprotein-sorting protein